MLRTEHKKARPHNAYKPVRAGVKRERERNKSLPSGQAEVGSSKERNCPYKELEDGTNLVGLENPPELDKC